ncbi:MAG: hypothetical protein AAF378_11875 [Cyanobacteria bacterium P01_A01_bin.84]
MGSLLGKHLFLNHSGGSNTGISNYNIQQRNPPMCDRFSARDYLKGRTLSSHPSRLLQLHSQLLLPYLDSWDLFWDLMN